MSAKFLVGHDSAVPLRCPVCTSSLSFEATLWRCGGNDTHEFPDIAGVPILLNPARSLFRTEDFHEGARTTFKDSEQWALRLARLLPSPSRDVSARKCRQRLAD